MAKNTIKKIIQAGLIAAATLWAAEKGVKEVALNVMSHAGADSSMATFRDASTYFTRGPYKGFNNFLGDNMPYGCQERPKIDLDKKYSPSPAKGSNPEMKEVDLNAIYLGLQKNCLPVSEFRPQKMNVTEDTVFHSIAPFITHPEKLVKNIEGINEEGLAKILGLKVGETVSYLSLAKGHEAPLSINFTSVDLGGYTLSFGRDSRGIYTSLYDKWDFAPTSGYFKENPFSQHKIASKVLPKLGKPIRFYDRFYWQDFTNKFEGANNGK